MVAEIKRTCPDCSSELVIRTNRKTQTEFWGCSRFPECAYTTEISAYEHMRRAGASTLPGFD